MVYRDHTAFIKRIIGVMRHAEVAGGGPMPYLNCRQLPSVRNFGSSQNASIFCQYVHFVGRPRGFPGLFSAPVVPTPVAGEPEGPRRGLA
jgi:hypothetical protein